MKKYKLQKSLLVGLLLCSALFSSCKDDDIEVNDLFRPRMMDEVVIRNSVTVAWYDIHAAVSYSFEAGFNSDFSEPIVSETLERPLYKLEDQPYDTRIYYRVRANAADPQHSSAWVSGDVRTLKRIVPMILNPVDKENILENEVFVTWTIDPENPVDSIGATPLNITEDIVPVGRYLTEEEIAAGSAVLAGLEKNTVYKLNIFDSSKPGTYDKPYNEVQFRTAGPPAGAIEISIADDLGRILRDNDTDPAVAEGTTYYIEAGGVFEINGFTVTKGLRLVAAPGVRPKINCSGNYSFSGSVSEFYIEGIDLHHPNANGYFINNGSGGANFEIGEFSLVDCVITGCDRGFIRTQGDGDKNFGHFLIDNCFINVVETYGNNGYGFILLNSAKDRLESLTVTNTTFYNTCKTADAGKGKGLIEAQNELGSMDITISNCTFYDSFAGTLLLAQNLAEGTAVFEHCLFSGLTPESGEPMNHIGIFRISPNVTSSAFNNYYTVNFKLGNYPLPTPPIKLDADYDELFESPTTGNLTIIDKTSPAYENRVGDPRWLK